jgi:hypothetical protein
MVAGSFFEEAVENDRPISTMSGQEVAEASNATVGRSLALRRSEAHGHRDLTAGLPTAA